MTPHRPPDLSVRPYTREDALVDATRGDGLPRVDVYVPERPQVVLGRGSKPALELYQEACQIDGIPLFRRQGGGCAVVLDPGQVIISLALAVPGIGENNKHFDRITLWILKALADLGHRDLVQRGISDLAMGDRKVGGACIHRSRGLLHYSTTLLVRPAVHIMERYLRHPPREPEYRLGRPHRQFVGSLADAGPASDPGACALHLQRRLLDSLDPAKAIAP